MERKIEMKEIQQEALKILLAFVELCQKNGLTYYISGGTYLGAVRHHGFIPWDDDVDVAMPRKDFNQFLEIAKTQLPKEYQINYYKTRSDSMYYVPKIENPKYKFISQIAQKEKIINLWIDVFPLDGLPEQKLNRKFHCMHLLALRGLYKIAYFDMLVNYQNTNRPWYENFIIQVTKKFPVSRLVDGHKVMEQLDKVLSKYDFYTSRDIMNFMGSYKFKSIMNREEIYAEGALYEFEGHMLYAPKEFDKYLTQIYGDYHQLPPEQERNWHKTFILQEQ